MIRTQTRAIQSWHERADPQAQRKTREDEQERHGRAEVPAHQVRRLRYVRSEEQRVHAMFEILIGRPPHDRSRHQQPEISEQRDQVRDRVRRVHQNLSARPEADTRVLEASRPRHHDQPGERPEQQEVHPRGDRAETPRHLKARDRPNHEALRTVEKYTSSISGSTAVHSAPGCSSAYTRTSLRPAAIRTPITASRARYPSTSSRAASVCHTFPRRSRARAPGSPAANTSPWWMIAILRQRSAISPTI